MHRGITESNVLELMRKVQEGEKDFRNNPLYMPDGETCYVFYCKDLRKKRDWKADGYRWRQNGIKKKQIDDKLVQKTYYHVYAAPGKISGEFQRTAYECSDFPNVVVILYKGDSSVAGSFPHGNRRRDAKPYSMTKPSVLSACRKAAGSASEVYDKLLAKAKLDSPAHPLAVPRDRTQVMNSQKIEKRRQRKLMWCIHNMQGIMGNASFSNELKTSPDLLLTFYDDEMLTCFSQVIDNTTEEEEVTLSVVTLWKLEEFTFTAIVYVNSDFHHSEIPILYFLHHNNTFLPIDTLWKTACTKVAKLHKCKHASLSYSSSGPNCDILPEKQFAMFSSVVDKLMKWEKDPLLATSKLKEIAKNQYDMSLVFASKVFEDKMDFKNSIIGNAAIDCGLIDQLIGENNSPERVPKGTKQDDSCNSQTPVLKKISKELLFQAKSVKPSDITYCLERRCFVVKDGYDIYDVKVFPKQQCTCLDALYCKHIVACKISLGMLEIPKDFNCAMEHNKLSKDKTASPGTTAKSSKEYDITLELNNDYLDDGIMGISEEVTIANETM